MAITHELFNMACFGKQQFRNVSLAHAAASRRAGRGIYKCRVCGYWHVGNKQRHRRRKHAGMSCGRQIERF